MFNAKEPGMAMDDALFKAAVEAAVKLEGAERAPLFEAFAHVVRDFLLDVERMAEALERIADAAEGVPLSESNGE
jgi:hypothetical protein